MEDKPIYDVGQKKTSLTPQSNEIPLPLKIQIFFKKFWNILLIVAGYIFSFYIGHTYEKFRSTIESQNTKFPETKTRKEISVSVNDRGELVFMDRVNNEITIYDDTIGFVVYDFYSTHLSKK